MRHTEFFYTTELSVPLFQIELLLTLSSLALLTNYLFTLYWGYVLNRESLLGLRHEGIMYFDEIYFGFGIAITILVLIVFLYRKD